MARDRRGWFEGMLDRAVVLMMSFSLIHLAEAAAVHHLQSAEMHDVVAVKPKLGAVTFLSDTSERYDVRIRLE